jgi:hypothetical protein
MAVTAAAATPATGAIGHTSESGSEGRAQSMQGGNSSSNISSGSGRARVREWE